MNIFINSFIFFFHALFRSNSAFSPIFGCKTVNLPCIHSIQQSRIMRRTKHFLLESLILLTGGAEVVPGLLDPVLEVVHVVLLVLGHLATPGVVVDPGLGEAQYGLHKLKLLPLLNNMHQVDILQ